MERLNRVSRRSTNAAASSLGGVPLSAPPQAVHGRCRGLVWRCRSARPVVRLDGRTSTSRRCRRPCRAGLTIGEASIVSARRLVRSGASIGWRIGVHPASGRRLTLALPRPGCGLHARRSCSSWIAAGFIQLKLAFAIGVNVQVGPAGGSASRCDRSADPGDESDDPSSARRRNASPLRARIKPLDCHPLPAVLASAPRRPRTA